MIDDNVRIVRSIGILAFGHSFIAVFVCLFGVLYVLCFCCVVYRMFVSSPPATVPANEMQHPVCFQGLCFVDLIWMLVFVVPSSVIQYPPPINVVCNLSRMIWIWFDLMIVFVNVALIDWLIAFLCAQRFGPDGVCLILIDWLIGKLLVSSLSCVVVDLIDLGNSGQVFDFDLLIGQLIDWLSRLCHHVCEILCPAGDFVHMCVWQKHQLWSHPFIHLGVVLFINQSRTLVHRFNRKYGNSRLFNSAPNILKQYTVFFVRCHIPQISTTSTLRACNYWLIAQSCV